jgi:hypothetical protein
MQFIIKTKESGPGQTNRPGTVGHWAAFSTAEWASQQKLDWSQRERVFEMLKKADAEVKQRRNEDRG